MTTRNGLLSTTALYTTLRVPPPDTPVAEGGVQRQRTAPARRGTYGEWRSVKPGKTWRQTEAPL